MLNALNERIEMTRVLLGAGEYIGDNDGGPRKIFGDMMKKYELDFAPEGIQETVREEKSSSNNIATGLLSGIR